jgi:hypothetical protein
MRSVLLGRRIPSLPGAEFTRINARTDARRSPQNDERPKPRPQARSKDIGTYTNRRKPKPWHA